MKKSAGILLYRFREHQLEVFIVHPGGPFWKNKDAGAWSIPKGEFVDGENPLNAALREFNEETGFTLSGDFISLQPARQRTGKWIHPFAQEGDLDPNHLQSNTIHIEWPPRSGQKLEIPEIDKGAWFDYDAAVEKINPGQVPILNDLLVKLGMK